jgi:hypothetical protein
MISAQPPGACALHSFWKSKWFTASGITVAKLISGFCIQLAYLPLDQFGDLKKNAPICFP